jgi:hypothetical protein
MEEIYICVKCGVTICEKNLYKTGTNKFNKKKCRHCKQNTRCCRLPMTKNYSKAQQMTARRKLNRDLYGVHYVKQILVSDMKKEGIKMSSTEFSEEIINLKIKSIKAGRLCRKLKQQTQHH